MTEKHDPIDQMDIIHSSGVNEDINVAIESELRGGGRYFFYKQAAALLFFVALSSFLDRHLTCLAFGG
jgi:hypothetical protein